MKRKSDIYKHYSDFYSSVYTLQTDFVNERQCWISMDTHAVWYSNDFWRVGYSEDIGSQTCTMKAPSSCKMLPFQGTWSYLDQESGQWIEAGENLTIKLSF